MITTVLVTILVFGLAGSMAAQETPGGELGFGGQLIDKNGNWIADFELWAVEAPTEVPEYFPNGSFDEEVGEEWGNEALGLNNFGSGEPDLPEPFDGVSLALTPHGEDGTGFGMVCLGWTEPEVTYDVNMAYFIDGVLGVGPDEGMNPLLLFFGPSEDPCNTGEQTEVRGGWLTDTDWTEFGFSGQVPAGYESFALAFDFNGIDGSAYLDNVSVTGPATPGQPGIGEMYFSIAADSLTACDTHGPSAEPGFEGILGDIGCGGSSGQAVSINACEATLETHGFVHSDAPNTTFLGQVVIDIDLEITNKKNSNSLGTLEISIYTPKDVIEISGDVLKGGADGFMDTCDKLDLP